MNYFYFLNIEFFGSNICKSMNLHEYQGKNFRKHGVRIQRGYVAETVDEAITMQKDYFKKPKPLFFN